VVGEKEKSELEQAALTCPVAQSLSPRIDVRTVFTWKK
jgi:hypothetical protein